MGTWQRKGKQTVWECWPICLWLTLPSLSLQHSLTPDSASSPCQPIPSLAPALGACCYREFRLHGSASPPALTCACHSPLTFQSPVLPTCLYLTFPCCCLPCHMPNDCSTPCALFVSSGHFFRPPPPVSVFILGPLGSFLHYITQLRVSPIFESEQNLL